MSKVSIGDICNWIRRVKPSNNAQDYGVTNRNTVLSELLLMQDVADARHFLTKEGYQHAFIQLPPYENGVFRWVLVFATNEQLSLLRKLGHAFQFDGCAKINKWEATLSTIIVQTSPGTWVSVGQIINE